MKSPKAKIYLENGFNVITLLDASVEINIMTKKLIKDVHLAIRQGPKLELVSHIGYSWLFLNFCEDVEVSIGRLKTRHSIFVIEARDHDLALDQLFLNSVKFS